MGAVVSEYFVLTAAHCFTVDDEKHSVKVSVGKDATNQSGASATPSGQNLPLSSRGHTPPDLNAAPSLARWTT